MRTFIAVELNEEIRKKIEEAESLLKKTETLVSWVKPGNVHVTLKFLGEVPEKQLENVYSGTQIALSGMRSFNMSLKNLGCFPDLKKPRVVWVGVDKGKVELSQMQRRIEEELYKLGFPKEDRKFSPHLTIGRAKSPKNMEKLVELIEKTDFKTEEVTVTEVVVMKSQLHRLGAIYTPMKKINLSS